MLFTGHHEHTIDAKGRLAIPADIRAQWRAEEHGGAWYALPWVDGSIRLYTEADFHKLANPVMPNSLAFGKDKAALKRMFFGRSSRLEMDAAGRIRLPEKMRSLVGLGKDVVLIGCGDCFEIANRDPWNEGAADDLKLMAELVEKLETAQAGEQAAG